MSTPTHKPTKRRVTVMLELDVDLDAYASDYGMTFEEARDDAPGHLREIALDAFGERLQRLGYAELVK